MSFSRILVAVDTSELSQTVFARALELAQACSAKLHLCHCLNMEAHPELIVPAMSVGMTDMGSYPRLVDASVWQEHMQQQQKQVLDLLKNYSQTAVELGIPTEYKCHQGEVGSSICSLAKEWQADLVMMGRRGRTGLSEALLGSVSNYVLHHAPCAVLVIQ
jgi:nucleotide-binding universal stress UspA family protein